jgi:hypothetical protein
MLREFFFVVGTILCTGAALLLWIADHNSVEFNSTIGVIYIVGVLGSVSFAVSAFLWLFQRKKDEDDALEPMSRR